MDGLDHLSRTNINWSLMALSSRFSDTSCHSSNLCAGWGGWTEGDKSGGYRGKLDQSTVHGYGGEACCLAFPVLESVPVSCLG